MRSRRFGLLIAVLFLGAVVAGCAAEQTKPPKVVEVVVTKYVKVPADLTKHGKVPMPQTRSVEEAVRVARVRRTDLEVCYGNLDAIEGLGGTPTPDAVPAHP
jgi:hypothetical protein